MAKGPFIGHAAFQLPIERECDIMVYYYGVCRLRTIFVLPVHHNYYWHTHNLMYAIYYAKYYLVRHKYTIISNNIPT